MKFRKLRIAWSVGWGLICLLLIALWMIGSWRLVGLVRQHSNCNVIVATVHGTIAIGIEYRGNTVSRWRFQNVPVRNASDDEVWSGAWFKRSANAGETFVFAPIWFLLALSTALFAAPWLRFRFSLRTLLIVTTLIAVVLGIIVWMSRTG